MLFISSQVFFTTLFFLHTTILSYTTFASSLTSFLFFFFFMFLVFRLSYPFYSFYLFVFLFVFAFQTMRFFFILLQVPLTFSLPSFLLCYHLNSFISYLFLLPHPSYFSPMLPLPLAIYVFLIFLLLTFHHSSFFQIIS